MAGAVRLLECEMRPGCFTEIDGTLITDSYSGLDLQPQAFLY